MSNIIIKFEKAVVDDFDNIRNSIEHFIEKLEGHGHNISTVTVQTPAGEHGFSPKEPAQSALSAPAAVPALPPISSVPVSEVLEVTPTEVLPPAPEDEAPKASA